MQKEKLASIVLFIIIFGAVATYIGVSYGDEILGNLFVKEKVIEIGDCADIHYIGRLEDGTIFESTYENPELKTGGTPREVFISMDPLASSPRGYPQYRADLIEGFMQGLIGLKQGETAVIGPIPPEEGYGRPAEIGDEITISYPDMDDQTITIVDIKYNVAMPDDFSSYFGYEDTTVFTLKNKIDFEIGEKTTLYPAWENATEYIYINETIVRLYTTPPEDKMNNFTWFDLQMGIEYPENVSSVTSINDTAIVIQHNPKIGDVMAVQGPFGELIFTVVNLSSEKINCSFENPYTSEIEYELFDRIEIIQRNETQAITFEYPLEALQMSLDNLVQYDLDVEYHFSLDSMAGKIVSFEIKIIEIHKTSQLN